MLRWFRQLAILAVSGALPAAQTPQIWFCPLDPLVRTGLGYAGSPQYMRLFTPDAEWPDAAARVNVFKIYPQWAAGASDADLRTQFADLRRRGIVLALEWGMLTPEAMCGSGVEGFGGQSTVGTVRRIIQLGGDLRFIAMDEPIYFGTLYNGPNACRWTVERMAANAAANIASLHQEFPQVAVGDIEPLPVEGITKDWLSQYGRGMDALQTAIGAPLAFIHSDVGWISAQWPAAVSAMRRAVEERGIPFGVIYNGDEGRQSDADWIQAADSRMGLYEGSRDAPDHVIFQSWNKFPQVLLPESEPFSFTNLINRYFRTRTRLTAVAEAGNLSGRLSTGAGDAIPGASLDVTATPESGDGVESVYVVEGSVPQGATQLVLGLRVNVECGCSAPADFRVRRFRIEAGTSAALRDFSQGLTDWNVTDGAAATIEDGQLHVTAGDGQPVLLNSAPLAIAADGGRFRLTVTATVSPRSAGSGYFTAVFLGDTELSRAQIPIAPPVEDLGTITTGSDGQFSIPLPNRTPTDSLVTAVFAGTRDFWPATAAVSPGDTSSENRHIQRQQH